MPSFVHGERGSSPRVRGRPTRLDEVGRDERLIPACAGQTQLPYRDFDVNGAHPRVCGADTWRPAMLHRPKGIWGQLRRAVLKIPRVCGEL